MGSFDEFPNERMRWMDDLLRELQKFSERYELAELEGELSNVRKTLVVELTRVNANPDHPIHSLRGLRDN